MCPPRYHHNGFMATLELGHRMYGYTLWGRIALCYIIILIVLTEINECVSNPCQNDGLCKDYHLMYNCTCKLGYNGTHCEIGRSFS